MLMQTCVPMQSGYDTSDFHCEPFPGTLEEWGAILQTFPDREIFQTPEWIRYLAESQGGTPVILVMGNDDGGFQANYHGTTVLTQTVRGMWPEFYAAIEKAQLYRVCQIRPNNIADLEAAPSVRRVHVAEALIYRRVSPAMEGANR